MLSKNKDEEHGKEWARLFEDFSIGFILFCSSHYYPRLFKSPLPPFSKEGIKSFNKMLPSHFHDEPKKVSTLY